MALLHVTLLGGFAARLEPGPPVVLARKKAQALLAFLVVEPGEAHLRDKLAALLWGDSSDQRARQSLRQTLLALRQSLAHAAPDLLRIDGETVAVDRRAVQVDVSVLARLVAEGTPEALERAVALYTGDFLEGLGVQEPRFEEWLIRERERLRELILEALARLLAHQTHAGADDHAIRTAGRLLALDPLQEAVHRMLMRLYVRRGRRGAALRQYQICVALLRRELGTDPETATKQLYQEILQSRRTPAALVAPAATPGAPPAPDAAQERSDASIPDTPMVGRAAELAALLRLRADAWRGEPSLAVIQGEAGIGKSRLIDALVLDTIAAGGRVLLGHAHESERILPFAPWVDALRSSAAIGDLARHPGLSEPWRVQLARLFPELGLRAAAAEEEGEHGRLFEGLAHAVGLLAGQQPLLLALEDLHWADEMSLRMLASLSRRIAGWPIVLVATLRTEEVIDSPVLANVLRELRSTRHFVSLALAPLSAAETVALVRLLARAGTGEAAVQRLGAEMHRVSEGNPFMVVESMRSQQEDGGDETLGAEPRTPERVRDVIAARLARLGERGRQLAALASVIGREFDFALLDRAAGLGADAAAEGVEELVARRILHVVGERLDFTHQRICDVAYAALIPPRRRVLHGAVARAIEELYGGDLEAHCVALGLHCRRAELWEQTVPYLRQAGLLAARRGAHRQAIVCFEQGLDALRHLPDRREFLEQAIDLRFALRNSCVAAGEVEQIANHLRDAEATADALADRLRLGWVLAYRTSCHFLRGEYDQAMDAGQRAVELAGALADPKLQIAAHLYFAQTCAARGQYRRAADLLRRNIHSFEREVAGRGETPAQQIYTRSLLTLCLAELGEFAEGLAHGEEAVRFAEAAERQYAFSHACVGLGLLYLRRGALESALPLLRRGLALCDGLDAPLLAAALSSLLGYTDAMSGNAAEAIPLIERAIPVLAKFMQGDSLSVIFLAEAYLFGGRAGDAAALARDAVALTERRSERGFAAWAHRLLAETRCHDSTADAEASYQRALDLAEELGMMPLRAHCHLGRGRLRRRLGDRDGARADLAAAVQLFRAGDMSLWLPAAERELGGV